MHDASGVLTVPGPTLGTAVRSVAERGITLTEAKFEPRASFPWHSHPHASFCMLLDGAATEEVRHSRYALKRHDLSYKPAGALHTNTIGDQGARALIIELTADWIAANAASLRHALSTACVVDSGDLGRRLYDEVVRGDTLSPLAIQSICLELLVRVARSANAQPRRAIPPWLRRVRELLHDRCVEHLSMDDIARSAGVHPVHLAQVFRRHYGLTVGEYVRRLRIQRGAQALLTSTRPIADIAAECGFCDQSHFSRVFKRVTSISPAQYRMQEDPWVRQAST